VKVIVLFNIGSVESAWSPTGDKMYGCLLRLGAGPVEPALGLPKLVHVMAHEGKVRAPLRSARCTVAQSSSGSLTIASIGVTLAAHDCISLILLGLAHISPVSELAKL